MISQRAWLIGGIGFCFYLIAIVNTLPSFYYALTWLAVGVLGSSLAIALLSLIGLRCSWEAPASVISQSLDFDAESDQVGPVVDVHLANAGTLNKTGILIEIHLQRAGEDEGKKEKDRETLKRVFLLEALPSGQSLTTQLPLLNLPRGRWQTTEIKLVGSDVLGLFRIQKRVPPGMELNCSGEYIENGSTPAPASLPEVVVGPGTMPVSQQFDIRLAPGRGESGMPAARFLGQGDEIRGTRLYAPGDDLRHVHWKSTARKGQLVVKEFHHTMQTRAVVVWDGAMGTDWGSRRSRPGRLHLNTTEWGLVLVASLCRALEERHQPCTLLRLDSNPLRAGNDNSSRPMPNGALSNAALSMTQVAQYLANADAQRETSMSAALGKLALSAGTDEADRGGDVFCVTASLSDELPRIVSSWVARGARVTVAQLDTPAFFEKGPLLKTHRQSWPQSSASEGGELEITEANMRAQAQALRAAGARVLRVGPLTGESGASVLNAVLHEMLTQRVLRHEVETETATEEQTAGARIAEFVAAARS